MLRRGAIAKRPRILEVRPLTREDLACLTEKRAGPPTVQKLRDTHHRVARLIAAGMRYEEVAELSGYSYQRIYVLTTDPAFQELVATYRGKVDEAFIRAQDQYQTVAISNMMKAETMIADKLDDAIEAGEHLPTKDLIAISRDAADRFGYGKKSFVAHASVSTHLEKAMVRSGRTIVVDAKGAPTLVPSPVGSAPKTTPPDQPVRTLGGVGRRGF